MGVSLDAFTREHLEIGIRSIDDADIVRLHGPSDSHRPCVGDGLKVRIFAEVRWTLPTRCRTGHLGPRRVKPLRGSYATLRPFG